MKLSDYIVDFLIEKGITDAFGYPGGSVTNLIDSLHKREEICAHVVYHEQAASFAAAAYAQTSGKPGVAYATGGPGATNLITGIGHAFYDSLPIICLTGNVNTYESKGDSRIRQKAFQESDIVSVVKPLTKFCAYVESPEKIKYYLEKAYYKATTGRKGPVLLDLPMDILRAQVDVDSLEGFNECSSDMYCSCEDYISDVTEALHQAHRPCFVIGNAIKTAHLTNKARKVISRLGIPYVTSMIAFDALGPHDLNYGFLGAYGDRTANFIAAKSDLIISLGSRLDIRQVGAKREMFAPNAKIIRVDIDNEELKYKVHSDEHSYLLRVEDALDALNEIDYNNDISEWLDVCDTIKNELSGIDDYLPNVFMKKFSDIIPENTVISTDVGQNQVWVAQSFNVKDNQKFLFCGGMGAMGYSLPASIGAFYGMNKNFIPVCICGDGGLQMNIQELQFIVREHLPVKIIVFNNESLGMIRHFQEMYFEGRYFDTKPEGGYTVPAFAAIANAYGIKACKVKASDEIFNYRDWINDREPCLLEICINEDTYVFPKLEYGKPNQDQQPLLDRTVFDRINSL